MGRWASHLTLMTADALQWTYPCGKSSTACAGWHEWVRRHGCYRTACRSGKRCLNRPNAGVFGAVFWREPPQGPAKEDRMAYTPEPIDTSVVTLPEDLTELTEVLAKNAHDLWAQQRLADGWTYGPRRDDARKEHPCLVPYEQLPEEEKVYDRRAAIDTVKTLVVLGYQLTPPARHVAAKLEALKAVEATLAGTLSRLQAPDGLDLTGLLQLWQARQPSQWARTPDVYRHLGERLLRVGEPLVAYDVVTEGLG